MLVTIFANVGPDVGSAMGQTLQVRDNINLFKSAAEGVDLIFLPW